MPGFTGDPSYSLTSSVTRRGKGYYIFVWVFACFHGPRTTQPTFLADWQPNSPRFVTLLIALGVPRALYTASVLIGFCFGAQWPVMYAVISELFGLRQYPTLYNLGAVASPVGAYVLNVRVAGRIYDAEAARQHAAGGDAEACFDVECFVVTAVTVGGALVSLVLVWGTREFYRGDIYAKFRDGVAVEESPDDGGPPAAAAVAEQQRPSEERNAGQRDD